MKYRLLSSIYYENIGTYETQYEQRYNSESTYRFNFSIGENKAFVVINNNILQLINSILKLDKQFTVKANDVPKIALKQYRKKCIIDEIKMTNDIEGVISTRKEINEILEDLSGKKKGNRLYGLVKKYEMLTEEEIVLSNCTDIRKIYDELVLNEVAKEDSTHIPDGAIFRKDPVYIRSKTGKTIHTGISPESKIIEVLTDCLGILRNENYNKFVSIAVFHYMFGYVHPFYDGNGRISRFISSYLLSRELHPIVSYRLSYVIKKNTDGYYKSFKTVNDEKNKGEITSFVEYFLDILVQSLEELCTSLDERVYKLEHFKKQISILSTLENMDNRVQIILSIIVQNTLFGENGLSVVELSEITDIGLSKVRSSLILLEEKNLITAKRVSKRFVYDANLDSISKPKNT